MQRQLKTRGKRFVILAGLICAMLAGASLNSTDSAATPVEDWMRAQAEARDRLQYDRVLDIVRQHRPTAADGWRHTLATAIIDEARAQRVDPYLVAAIVAKESSFKSRVVSHAGAVGLMQLRPWVAEDVALRSDLEWNGLDTLHTPHLNVRLGVLYYRELIERFGDEQAALTAYCFGPSRVSMQMRRGTYRGSRYANDILSLYERLQQNAA